MTAEDRINMKYYFEQAAGYAYIALALSPLAILAVALNDRDKRMEEEDGQIQIEQEDARPAELSQTDVYFMN